MDRAEQGMKEHESNKEQSILTIHGGSIKWGDKFYGDLALRVRA